MSRLIDADDLPISSIDITDVGYYVSKYGQGIPAVYLEDIKDAPTIEPEQRWIPTSERLPEPDVDVLLQLSDVMATGYYFYDGWHVYFSVQRKDVIAWMPLPEPYEERR